NEYISTIFDSNGNEKVIKLLDCEGANGGIPPSVMHNDLSTWVANKLNKEINDPGVQEIVNNLKDKRNSTVNSFFPSLLYLISDIIFYVGDFGGGNIDVLREISS